MPLDFRQQRQIDAAILGAQGGDRNAQNVYSQLINSPEANAYSNQAMARLGFAQPSNPTQSTAQTQSFDGPGMTSTQNGQGMGGFGLTPDIFAQLFGNTPQVTSNGGGMYTGQQSETYGIMNPSEFGFGFGNGVPGGDVVQWLQQAGFPDVNLIQAIQQGRPLSQTNFNSASQQLGGVTLPSPQSLSRLGPSGIQFLMGLYSTMLGIPEEDVLYGSMQPFMGLGNAQAARQTGGFIR